MIREKHSKFPPGRKMNLSHESKSILFRSRSYRWISSSELCCIIYNHCKKFCKLTLSAFYFAKCLLSKLNLSRISIFTFHLATNYYTYMK